MKISMDVFKILYYTLISFLIFVILYIILKNFAIRSKETNVSDVKVEKKVDSISNSKNIKKSKIRKTHRDSTGNSIIPALPKQGDTENSPINHLSAILIDNISKDDIISHREKLQDLMSYEYTGDSMINIFIDIKKLFLQFKKIDYEFLTLLNPENFSIFSETVVENMLNYSKNILEFFKNFKKTSMDYQKKLEELKQLFLGFEDEINSLKQENKSDIQICLHLMEKEKDKQIEVLWNEIYTGIDQDFCSVLGEIEKYFLTDRKMLLICEKGKETQLRVRQILENFSDFLSVLRYTNDIIKEYNVFLNSYNILKALREKENGEILIIEIYEQQEKFDFEIESVYKKLSERFKILQSINDTPYERNPLILDETLVIEAPER